MTMDYDEEANAVYVRLRDLPYAYNAVLDDQRVIDYAEDRQPIGVELLAVSHGVNVDDLPQRDEIAQLLEEHNIKVFA